MVFLKKNRRNYCRYASCVLLIAMGALHFVEAVWKTHGMLFAFGAGYLVEATLHFLDRESDPAPPLMVPEEDAAPAA